MRYSIPWQHELDPGAVPYYAAWPFAEYGLLRPRNVYFDAFVPTG